jgi:hypothetical protein
LLLWGNRALNWQSKPKFDEGCAMTTKTWNTGTADWYTSKGGVWNPAGDPGSSDNVVINSGEPELLSGDAGINVARSPSEAAAFSRFRIRG